MFGENELIKYAQKAKEEGEIDSAKEQISTYIYNWSIERKIKGEDSTLNDEIIKEIISKNNTEYDITNDSIITKNGYKILISELYDKENIVSYTKDGVPIPKGFYFVGGSKEEGTVISDNRNDENKGTEHDIAQILEGNQFVWVSVENGKLQTTNYTELNGVSSTEFKENIPQEILDSINKYKGFYIARYEASYGSGDSLENYKPLSKVSKSICNGQLNNGNLWNYCNWNEAFYASKNMYSNINNILDSHLIYGAEWDTLLEWIGHDYAVNKTEYRNN